MQPIFMTHSNQTANQSANQVLRALMNAAGIASYRALAKQSGVSRWQVQQLRSGNIDRMRVATLSQIAKALNVSLEDLLQSFLDPAGLRLRSALGDEQVQRHALQTIETWLTQWATIAKRAQERGDALPAAKILPFVRPVEQLMTEWEVMPFATIDEQVPYDPQHHQLTKGIASPGDMVQVTHVGHTHHGKLLHRAKVKPVG